MLLWLGVVLVIQVVVVTVDVMVAFVVVNVLVTWRRVVMLIGCFVIVACTAMAMAVIDWVAVMWACVDEAFIVVAIISR